MNKALFKLLRYSGLPFIFRNTYQKNNVSILMFHDVDVDAAEKSFSYLVNRYTIISLNTFIEAYYKKDFSKIPPKSVIITFDDGHIGNYKLLPIVKKYNIPITIFLCSGIINTNRHFWFMTDQDEYDVQKLKGKKTKERLELLSTVGFYNEKEYETPQALSIDQIEEMKDYVNFQSHTVYHPILTMCTDNESKNEILFSKEQLESTYKLTINSIAYPNGDYSEREISYVKQSGYKCAVTTEQGFNSLQSDIFKLKRFSVNDTKDLNEFIVKSSGVWGMLKKIITK